MGSAGGANMNYRQIVLGAFHGVVAAYLFHWLGEKLQNRVNKKPSPDQWEAPEVPI